MGGKKYSEFTLEQRLLWWASQVGGLFSLLNLILALSLNPDLTKVGHLILGVVAYPFLVYSIPRYRIEVVGVPLVIVTQIILSLGWKYSGGSLGATDFVFVLLIVIYLSAFKRQWQVPLILILIINVATLLVYEYLNPEWVIPFETELDQRVDYVISLSLVAVCLLLVMWQVKKAYETETHKVAEVNQRLIEKQKALVEAKEMAEAGEKSKSEFLSIMSHEIRTPLNAIIGNADFLLMEKLPEDLKNTLQTIQFSAHSLHGLINDILDFNKIEAGKLELQPIVVNLKETCRQTLFTLKGVADEKLIELRLSFDPRLDTAFYVDEMRLNQILVNLLGNALKFTEKGHVELKVERLDLEGSQTKIRFAVIDTGVGIREIDQAKIFDQFTQASSNNTRRHGGTGLGLTITRSLLKVFNAQIQVKSEWGVGSQFWFDMELKKATTEEFVQTKMDKLANFEGNKRVLLVEDNPVNTAVATRFLEKWGLNVWHAENGKIAYEMVQKNLFDLVLMDIQMPEMDGYESTKKIRALGGEWAKIPILALSASAQIEDQKAAVKAGMSGFITKPFKATDFKASLGQFLNS